jgi:hypothetical protein
MERADREVVWQESARCGCCGKKQISKVTGFNGLIGVTDDWQLPGCPVQHRPAAIRVIRDVPKAVSQF